MSNPTELQAAVVDAALSAVKAAQGVFDDTVKEPDRFRTQDARIKLAVELLDAAARALAATRG